MDDRLSVWTGCRVTMLVASIGQQLMSKRIFGISMTGALIILCGVTWAYLAFWKPDDEALRILARMNASYANCKSLRDRIDVTAVDESDSGAKSTNAYVAHVAFAGPPLYAMNSNL